MIAEAAVVRVVVVVVGAAVVAATLTVSWTDACWVAVRGRGFNYVCGWPCDPRHSWLDAGPAAHLGRNVEHVGWTRCLSSISENI